MLSANGARDSANRCSLDGLEFPDFPTNLSQGFGSIGGGVPGVTTRVIQLAAKIQF
jgi:hypothetical protein